MARKQSTPPKRPPTRRQLARWERERRTQRTILALGLGAILLILGIPAFGYYESFVLPPREAVVKVNDTTFDMGYYVKRLRFLKWQSETIGQRLDTSIAPFQLIEDVENEELLRQGSPRFNIAITKDDVEEELRRRVLPPKGEGQEVSDAQLDAEYRQRYQRFLNDTQLADVDYRRIVEADLLRSRLRDKVGDQVPTVAEQVHVQLIQVGTQEEANKALERLKGGEDFAAVAREVSTHEDTSRKGGDLGWLPKGVMLSPFDDFAFSLEVGALSEPFATREGIIMFKLVEKAEARQVDDKAREGLKDRALESWLLEERKANDVQRFINSEKYAWALRQLGELVSGPPLGQ